MKKYIILLFATAICFGCSSDETPTIEYPICDYFPLQEGNKWYYEGSISEITGKEIVDGLEWFVMSTVYERENKEPVVYRLYFRKTADGKVYRKSEKSSEAVLLFDLKIGFNQSWKYTDGDEQWTVSTGADFATIKIEDISFANCRSYYYDIPEAVDDEHLKILAPGLGLLLSNSIAWGLGDTLQHAVINGLEMKIKE